MYANYSHFIERAEVRIFAPEQSLEAEPLALVAFGPDGSGEWQPEPETFATPARELKYVLRAYGSGGTFDETVPQPLWIAYREIGAVAEQPPADAAAGGARRRSPCSPSSRRPARRTRTSFPWKLPRADADAAAAGTADAGDAGSLRCASRTARTSSGCATSRSRAAP